MALSQIRAAVRRFGVPLPGARKFEFTNAREYAMAHHGATENTNKKSRALGAQEFSPCSLWLRGEILGFAFERVAIS